MHGKNTSYPDLERSPAQGDFFIENIMPPDFVMDLIKRLPEIRAKAHVAKQKLAELEAGIDPELHYSPGMRDLHKLSHVRVAMAAAEAKSQNAAAALGLNIYRPGTAPADWSRGYNKPQTDRNFPTASQLANQPPIAQEASYRDRLINAAYHPEDAVSAIKNASDRISRLISRSWNRIYPFSIGVSLYMVTPSKFQKNIGNLNRFTGMEYGIFYGYEESPAGFRVAQLEDHIQLILYTQAEFGGRDPQVTVNSRGIPIYDYFDYFEDKISE